MRRLHCFRSLGSLKVLQLLQESQPFLAWVSSAALPNHREYRPQYPKACIKESRTALLCMLHVSDFFCFCPCFSNAQCGTTSAAFCFAYKLIHVPCQSSALSQSNGSFFRISSAIVFDEVDYTLWLASENGESETIFEPSSHSTPSATTISLRLGPFRLVYISRWACSETTFSHHLCFASSTFRADLMSLFGTLSTSDLFASLKSFSKSGQCWILFSFAGSSNGLFLLLRNSARFYKPSVSCRTMSPI